MLSLKEVLTFILSPIVIYPYWFVITFLQNRFLGDNSLYLWLQFDSKRALLNLIIENWLHALPFSYLFVLLILMPAYYLLKIAHNDTFINFNLLTIMLGLPFCLYFIGYNLFAVSSTIIACILLATTIMLLNRLLSIKKRLSHGNR